MRDQVWGAEGKPQHWESRGTTGCWESPQEQQESTEAAQTAAQAQGGTAVAGTWAMAACTCSLAGVRGSCTRPIAVVVGSRREGTSWEEEEEEGPGPMQRWWRPRLVGTVVWRTDVTGRAWVCLCPPVAELVWRWSAEGRQVRPLQI